MVNVVGIGTELKPCLLRYILESMLGQDVRLSNLAKLSAKHGKFTVELKDITMLSNGDLEGTLVHFGKEWQVDNNILRNTKHCILKL